MNDKLKIMTDLKKMFNLLKRNAYHEFESVQSHGLTPVQWMVLAYIMDNSENDIFQKDIETAFNIRRSSVTSLIKALEQKCYIKRETVENDARLKKLTLNEKSRTLCENLKRRMNILEMKMTKDISDEEFAILHIVMEKVNKNLEE